MFDQPCMNPEAPEPPGSGGAGAGPSGTGQQAAAGDTSGPDYTALLKYLQFYQKQMDEPK